MRRTEVVLDIILILLLILTAVLGYYQPARVGLLVGESMEPTMNDGDLTIYKPNAEADVGDIIVFSSPKHNNALIIHRVVKENTTHYVTKGDNNPVRDTPVQRDSPNYKGKLIYHIPLPGDSPIQQKEFIKSEII